MIFMVLMPNVTEFCSAQLARFHPNGCLTFRKQVCMVEKRYQPFKKKKNQLDFFPRMSNLNWNV